MSQIRLKQIRIPDEFDDSLSTTEIANIESNASNLDEALNGVFSQIKRMIHGDSTGNWYDDPGVSLVDNKLYIDFDFNDVASGSLSLGNCPANISISTVSLSIDEIFDGSTTITVGDSSAQGRLMAVADNSPTQLGNYKRDVDYLYSVETEIFIFFPTGTPTQGSGKIFVYLS